mgnify:CR=1 FL=1
MMDDAGRDTMEADDKCRTKGTKVVPIVVPDPPQVGGGESRQARKSAREGHNRLLVL